MIFEMELMESIELIIIKYILYQAIVPFKNEDLTNRWDLLETMSKYHPRGGTDFSLAIRKAESLIDPERYVLDY